MTDNEIRAHDLTMLYMKEQMKRNYYNVAASDYYNNSVNIDFVSGYIDLYTTILNRLEQNLV